jgi:hypothetical protein
MNDFTKDEIMLLVYSINTYMMLDRHKEKEGLVLLNKLRNMSDNYCEHSFYLNGCGEGAFAQCHKCGEIQKVVRNK